MGVQRPGRIARYLERLDAEAGDPRVRDPRRSTVRLAVAGAVIALVDLALGLAGPPTTGWAGPYAGIALALLVDASLVALVRFPRAVAGVTVAASLAMLVSDLLAPGLLVPQVSLSPVTVPRAATVVVLWLVVHLDRRFALGTTAVLTVLACRPWSPSWAVVPTGLLATLTPAVLGLYLVARFELLTSLRERAERAEREQHLLAERARAEERRRLAAEMHDAVTHQLSLIVLQAGALGVTAAEPAARDAAADIRTAGARALDELRDLVGVLAGDPAGPPGEPATPDGGGGPSAPDGRGASVAPDGRGGRTAPGGRGGPAVPHPSTLADESAAAGVPVAELAVTGAPEDVSPTVARTAYRVVQEALTNARKHAPGSTVSVRLRYRAEGVLVEVSNTAAAAPPDPALAGSGSGTGLRGLAQRVRLVGGSLRAEPLPDGGFRVGAVLPGQVPTAGPDREPAR